MNYEYLIVDAQLVHTRNYFAIRNTPNYSPQMGASIFFQSINKAIRESGITVEKVILFWDTFPYYKRDLLSEYKSDRPYVSLDNLEDLIDEIDIQSIRERNNWFDISDDEVIRRESERLEREAKLTEIKNKTKTLIKSEFSKLGIPSFGKSGFEADDLAYAFAEWNKERNPEKKSLFMTTDEDWGFVLNETVDQLKYTKNEIYNEEIIKDRIKDFLGIIDSPYEFHRTIQSLVGSHNNLQKVLKEEFDPVPWEDLLIQFKEKGFSEFVIDPDLHKAQYESFNINSFPGYDNLKKMFYYLDKKGSLMTESQIQNFSLFKNIYINSNDYMNLISMFNPNKFKDTVNDEELMQ